MINLNFRRGSAFASKEAREYLKTIQPQEINTITVIRHAAIGDFMNIRPFLIGIREYFPNAKITLSVNRSAMYGMPNDLIDDVHIMDKDDPDDKSKKTSIFSRIKQAKTLPPQDVIFDLTDSSMTLLLIIFSQAKLKIGYPYRKFRRRFYDMSVLRSDFNLEADTVQHMLNLFGFKKNHPLRYGYENTYPKNIQKRIVYFAGASMKNKCWEEEKFVQLIKQLSTKYNDYEHVILQGIKDDEKFEDIYSSFESNTNVSLHEPMPLEETMQYLADTKCLVSNDTGVRNMAIAVETATVGIFFTTIPYRYWPKDNKHECVFNMAYSSPSIDDVFEATNKVLKV